MSGHLKAAWLRAEVSLAVWYADAALGAPTAALAQGYIKSAWEVCDGIGAALVEAVLLSAEREKIEEGLIAVRRRLQAFDGVEPEAR